MPERVLSFWCKNIKIKSLLFNFSKRVVSCMSFIHNLRQLPCGVTLIMSTCRITALYLSSHDIILFSYRWRSLESKLILLIKTISDIILPSAPPIANLFSVPKKPVHKMHFFPIKLRNQKSTLCWNIQSKGDFLQVFLAFSKAFT